MSPQRSLLVLAGIAGAAFLVSIGLLEHLSTFDPYSWAAPGRESDASRSLWLERRDLYRMIGVVSLMSAVLSSAGALILRRRWRRR
jgi:hypothetical protein